MDLQKQLLVNIGYFWSEQHNIRLDCSWGHQNATVMFIARIYKNGSEYEYSKSNFMQ